MIGECNVPFQVSHLVLLLYTNNSFEKIDPQFRFLFRLNVFVNLFS